MGKRVLDYVSPIPVLPITIDEPTPARTAEPSDPVTDQMVADQERIEHAVEVLFGRLAADQPLTANERMFLRQHCPPDAAANVHAFQRWLDGSTARVRAVQQLQAAAGSEADRGAAAEAAELARQRQAEQSPALQDQIAKLQADLQALAGATAAAERDIQRRAKAVEDLQLDHLLPQRIKECIAVVFRTNEQDKRKFLDAESRLRSLVGLLALNPDVKEHREQISNYAHSCPTIGDGRVSDLVFLRDPYRQGSKDIRLPEFQPAAWAAHCELLKIEAEQHRATIAALAPLNARVAAEVAALKCFLVPK